jgi:hypothetical protein
MAWAGRDGCPLSCPVVRFKLVMKFALPSFDSAKLSLSPGVASMAMVIHRPIFGDQGEANAAYIACGKLAVNWGPVELAMESIILRLRNRQRHPSVNNAYPDFPKGFKRKKDEIKKRLRNDPILSGLLVEMSAMLAEADRLHKARTTVVHSLCQGSNLNGDLMFGHSDHGAGVAFRPVTVKLSQVNTDAERMISLHGELIEMFHKIQTL